MTTTTTAPDLEAVNAKQQATWGAGDYAVIGTTLQIVGESLCEALDVAAGSRVLDVAAGNGNASLAAAWRGADVIASDYVEALLDRAAARAEADGLPLATRVAGAQALPFADGDFDAVLSTFGVMFTPNPERAEDRLHELLDSGAQVSIERRHFTFRFRSAAEYVERFRTFYGPLVRAWEALDDAGRTSLRDELTALADGAGRPNCNGIAIPSEYLEVVEVRR